MHSYADRYRDRLRLFDPRHPFLQDAPPDDRPEAIGFFIENGMTRKPPQMVKISIEPDQRAGFSQVSEYRRSTCRR